jgi:hypothetical protein
VGSNIRQLIVPFFRLVFPERAIKADVQHCVGAESSEGSVGLISGRHDTAAGAAPRSDNKVGQDLYAKHPQTRETY